MKMASKVITFASAKGGAGKTTLTATLGTFLAELGHTVLFVDCDEATNGLTLLYIDAVSEYPSVAREDKANCRGLFDEFDDSKLAVDTVSVGRRLWLCPAVFMFERQKPFTSDQFRSRLHSVIADIGEGFDFIILDAQAGADAVSLVAMEKGISELVVVVSEYDPLSAAGVERLKGIAGESLSFDRTWILLNKMLPEFVESFSEFLSVSHYLPPIPWTADVVRAYARRELALDFERGNEFTLAALQTIKALPITGLRRKIDEWVETKASVIRQPVDTQYGDTEDLLKSVTLQIRELSQTRLRRRTIVRAVLSVIFMTGFAGIISLMLNQTKILNETQAWSLGRITTVVLGGLVVIGAAIAVTEWFSERLSTLLGVGLGDVNSEIEIDRLQRQRSYYQEKLKELEFLRSADPATVLENRFSS